ncbi:uncharacterized protein LOC118428115 [Branchiostoma floridae]|uniref:Uncharacterized protein LOC118428115 n=1 Tax=Branchiostoma floridae TaxID=7739 RepID=A0A9J7M4T1_BRAFL|nr:uncharacterized protein LOC118428115 [Branchiostoma floridae]
MTKRRLALARAVTVYLEEGRLLSSDFLLPAGEAGCETAMLAYLQGSKNGVPTWDEMIGGNEFTVIFDMPYAIPGILHAQDVLELKFVSHMWFSLRRGDVPHLYDGYKNGGSGEIQAKKVSVQGLVMTYDDNMGVFTVTNEDFEASVPLVPDLPEWIKGRRVARAEYKKLLDQLSKKPSTTGDVPCNVHWSNAHRFDPTNGGKCIHFTAASEGDIFVVFASIPQNHETWTYIQISPEGVALYKGTRLQTTQLNYNAGGLGSTTLYQSYFVCVTEDVEKTITAIQYGKTPDNEERPHVWLSFSFKELASLRYYSFGSGEYPVKVMGLSLLDKQPKDFIICREGTELLNGMCQQKCHTECEGCRTSGSNSSVDCIACKHLKVSYPYIEGETGSFECVPQCPQHMEVVSTQTCTCIKKMEEVHPNGVVDCVTECPLTHFDNNNECRKCSSFCKDVRDVGARVCSGPSSSDCDTCKYQHEGRCLQGCSPGQKAVGESGTFICRQCQAGHECKLGDEREDICAAGTASNDNRTACEPCAAGLFSGSAGAASCQQCPPGTYSTGGGSTRCSTCPAETYSNAGASTCEGCHAGYRVHLANCYKAFNDKKSYVDAASVCRADGGRLATPRDKITNQFLITLKNKLDDSSWFWLGMDDRGREGSWRYIDGTRLGEFQPWAPGEPNQHGGNEDCGMFYQNPRNDWNDQDCSSKLYFICQMPFKTNEDVTSLGCWRDTPNRAIPMLEGTDPQLDGVYLERSDALRKCYQVARSRGLAVFSVQNGGQCFGSAYDSTYNKYGPSTACKMDGEGGPWANEVYQIITG